MASVEQHLLSMADADYKKFQCSLMPTVDPQRVIGIRMPTLRRFAKQMSGERAAFLESLPHKYYEEDNLHGIYISETKDFLRAIFLLDQFLPYVDNWATCDLLAPAAFRNPPGELIHKVLQWIASDHSYTVRFGIGVLMRYYLDDNFQSEYLSLVAGIQSNDYYVNMMICWYFATALAKQYDAAISYIEDKKLDPWCHRKTIQKALESYRISSEQKSYLRKLRKSFTE